MGLRFNKKNNVVTKGSHPNWTFATLSSRETGGWPEKTGFGIGPRNEI
jgi:hypothetical protein